ncbi:NAD(P)-binding domain-containing protein [Paenibacillus sp. HWE-109]|uniref:NAD(P)-binding domain-containing protein n=1 Tax=Paenibacillus sp. HWE-109 TaxID=1306526 RepID=UPI003FCE412F
MSMNIGILGAGNVGKILGEGFVQSGHRVLISSREPHNSKHISWKQEVGESGGIGWGHRPTVIAGKSYRQNTPYHQR